MSQVCDIDACSRAARALCHCCQQNVCIVHLNEHNDLLNSQLNPLIENVKILDEHLRTINIRQIVNNYREQLEEWRLDSHKKIDQFYEEKCQELDRMIIDKVDEQKVEVRQLQVKLNQLVHQQQATRQDFYELALMIDHIEHEINNIQESFIQIYNRPLILDYNLITIKGLNEQIYDLSSLSPVFKSISRSDGSYAALASNNKTLLIHQAPNLCITDPNLTIIKRVAWRHGAIHDMCWSKVLDLYIILEQRGIYFVNENTLSIDKATTVEKRKWLSCTCFEEYLFLSTHEWGSSITKIYLNSSKKLEKQWQSPDICKRDEYIDVITSNQRKLAVMIRNSSRQTIRLELRSPQTLDKIWSIVLDGLWGPNKPFHCCPFVNEDWLVADYVTGRLLHVTKTGIIRAVLPYNSVPYCVNVFNSKVLVISANDGIHFHNLNHKNTYTISLV